MANPDTSGARQGMFTVEGGKSVAVTFALVSSLFLLWGLCNGMIDVMDKHFQTELGLSKSQSAWVQFAHYLGYFLMALPAGWLATRLGYKGGIIAGLLMVAAGGFWFVPATRINAMAQAGDVSHAAAFVGYLAGVCAIAAGLTFLETVANPYTTVLGPKQYAATRINLAQSCNGVGWIFGPIIGGIFFYSTDGSGRSTGSETLYIPYLVVALVVLVLAVVFYVADIPDIKAEDDYHLDNAAPGMSHALWRRPHFVMAVAAQFLYVAAQAGIFSFFINYMTEEVPAIPASWGAGALGPWLEAGAGGGLRISDQGAANLASLGFVCFLTGRFTGAGLLRKVAAHKVLGLYGLLNVAACLLVFLKLGWLSVACVFLSYFFMSIMFPTIFALGIFGLGARAKQASAFIVMAIVGGALLPKVMGRVADLYDMSRGFAVPLLCFAFVAAYGCLWPRLSGAPSMTVTQAGGRD
ncbi:MAG TPA: MFS transporter [Vicinamibacterales bacterium]|nr:MFS transporter [Vicinamibacterales bacterium]HOG28853.1 MFS transporter [Vicinamibacterales bacterium]HOQ59928.1 MFS transporter [Vicinamibacterales bacterium]HPK70495.1 MFS transporter [Vicinamibacterales bacterium]HPW21361.1 MFS transporter [Vicinamibacterales bacterium]